jgi:hypothetical protein
MDHHHPSCSHRPQSSQRERASERASINGKPLEDYVGKPLWKIELFLFILNAVEIAMRIKPKKLDFFRRRVCDR